MAEVVAATAENDDHHTMLRMTDTVDGITFSVHVQPRASRNEVSGVRGEELRVRLTAPPVDDAANRLCVEFLAKLLGVAKSRLTIIAGEKSRHKTIKVTGIGREEIRAALLGNIAGQEIPS